MRVSRSRERHLGAGAEPSGERGRRDDRAGARREQPAQRERERGLAGAVRAGEHGRGPGRQRQVEALVEHGAAGLDRWRARGPRAAEPPAWRASVASGTPSGTPGTQTPPRRARRHAPRAPRPAPVGDEPALGAEHDDPVDEVLPHLDAVLDHDERRTRALEHAADRLAHLGDAPRVEVRRRLVEQQEPGRIAIAPASASRCFCPPESCDGGVVERQVEADRVDGPGDAAPGLLAGHAEVLAPERHVVADPREDDLRVRILQHEAGPSARGGRRPPSIRSEPISLALVVAAEHAREGVQQRRLARARRAEQQHPLARLDDEVEALQRGPRRPACRQPHPVASTRAGPARPVDGHGQTRPVTSRPAANRFRAPVARAPGRRSSRAGRRGPHRTPRR